MAAAEAAAAVAAEARAAVEVAKQRKEAAAKAAAKAVAVGLNLAKEVAAAVARPPAARPAVAAAKAPPKDFRQASGSTDSAPSAEEQGAPADGTTPTVSRQDAAPRPVRPYVATRRAIKEWRSLGASRRVIETIFRGVQIPWRQRPPQFRSQGYKLSDSDNKWATEELERWFSAGYLRELSPTEAAAAHCVVGAFVTHSAGKPRVVVDYRHPNSYMERRRFKYETLWELAPGLTQGDQLISWDIADAFHHLRIRAEDQPFLSFTIQGRVFAPLSMPVGLAITPFTWTKVCSPVVAKLREMGFVVTVYVDDLGGRPPVPAPGRPATNADAAAGWAAVVRLLETLGLRVHQRKGVKDGTTELPLLGHVVDMHLGVFRLQPQRVEKIETSAAALVRYASKHRWWVRFGALRSFCGMAVSTSLSVPHARFRSQSLFTLLGPAMRTAQHSRPRHRDVPLSHQARADLKWWANLTAHALLGRALWPQPDDATVHTDASMTGWGATWNGTVPARGFHAPERKHLHINVHELGTVRLALQSFVKLLQPKHTALRLMIESLVSVHVVNNGTSKSEAMMRELRLLHGWCQLHVVELRASHLPSAVNNAADRLSRSNDSTDWALSDRAFQRLEHQYGPHTLDSFATSLNNKCGRYLSRTADPGTAGVDAMSQNWASDNCWVNPPFQLIGSVLDKILRTKARATLIVPVWSAQPWWQRAVETCASWEELPKAEGVFTHDTQTTPAKAPKWRVAAFRFDGGVTRSPVSCAGSACATTS